MAEFQEVMRQLGRICASNFGECDICDLRPFCPSKTFLDKYVKSGRTERLEEMVLSWAAEHPEPVYPTWGEWLEQQGICFSRLTNYSRVDGVSIPKVFNYQIEGKTAFICGDKVNEPISADIAQKLGIEPKEGV